MKNTIYLLAFILVTSLGTASADRPNYSLDLNHPYNLSTAPGHASQSPGSPRWFQPGYGYRHPGRISRGTHLHNLNPYQYEYSFGRRTSVTPLRNDLRHQYWTNAYGGPWYFPGSTTYATPRVFSW